MECLNDEEPSGLYAATLTDEGRYRLLVEAVTDYAIYMIDVNGSKEAPLCCEAR
jgi:hypothetical protein